MRNAKNAVSNLRPSFAASRHPLAAVHAMRDPVRRTGVTPRSVTIPIYSSCLYGSSRSAQEGSPLSGEGDYYRGKNCLADKQAFLKAYKESACEINRSEPLLLPVIIA